MFIEKISIDKKEEFIKKYVQNLNSTKNDSFNIQNEKGLFNYDNLYRPCEFSFQDEEEEEVYKRFIKKYEENNIFIRFYIYSREDLFHSFNFQQAFIFVFEDTSFKFFNVNVGSICNVSELIRKTEKLFIKNKDIFLNKYNDVILSDYVKDLIVPNLDKSDLKKFKKEILKIYKQKRKNLIKLISNDEKKVFENIK